MTRITSPEPANPEPIANESADTTGKIGPRLLAAVDRTAILAMCALVVANLFALTARQWWFGELFCHFQWQYLVAAVVIGVWMAFRRRALLIATALLLVVIHGWRVWPYAVPHRSSTGDRAAASSERTLLHWNVFIRNPTHTDLLRAVEELDPDFVLLEEIGDDWERSLRALESRYPHRAIRSDGAPFGIAFFSKEPLAELRIVSRGELENYVVAKTTAGVTILGVHVMSPVGPRPAALRNRQLSELAAIVSELEGPVLLAGDLNLTPWSPYFQDLLQASGLRDPRRQFGRIPTWPNWNRLFHVPIDHMLASPDVEVLGLESPSLHCGSDHRPLVCRFRVAGRDEARTVTSQSHVDDRLDHAGFGTSVRRERVDQFVE